MNGTAKVALVGLLHNIGKFSPRVGKEQQWCLDTFTETFLHAFCDKLGKEAEQIITLAASPQQQVTDRANLCVKVADWLASAEQTNLTGLIRSLASLPTAPSLNPPTVNPSGFTRA